MTDLHTRYLGLELRSPLIASSRIDSMPTRRSPSTTGKWRTPSSAMIRAPRGMPPR
jgi:hypothetical protein